MTFFGICFILCVSSNCWPVMVPNSFSKYNLFVNFLKLSVPFFSVKKILPPRTLKFLPVGYFPSQEALIYSLSIKIRHLIVFGYNL